MTDVGHNSRDIAADNRLRKMDPADRREMEAVLETYKCALGME